MVLAPRCKLVERSESVAKLEDNAEEDEDEDGDDEGGGWACCCIMNMGIIDDKDAAARRFSFCFLSFLDLSFFAFLSFFYFSALFPIAVTVLPQVTTQRGLVGIEDEAAACLVMPPSDTCAMKARQVTVLPPLMDHKTQMKKRHT